MRSNTNYKCGTVVRAPLGAFASAVIGMACLTLGTTSVHAQTLMTWPDSRVDITKYQSIESCLAVVNRVGDSVRARDEVMRDTLPTTWFGDTIALPQPVQKAARTCMTRFPASNIPVDKLFLAQQLLLTAGQDADAAIAVQRRLDAVAPSNVSERTAILDSAIRLYLSAQPARLEAAQPLVEQFAPNRHLVDWRRRFGIYSGMVEKSKIFNRDDWVKHYSAEYFAIARALTDEERNEPDSWTIPIGVAIVSRILHHKEYMDSLGKNDAAYAQIQRAKIAEITGQDPATVEVVAGQQAPVLRGDFVFPVTAKDDRIPRLARVSLLVSMSSIMHGQYNEFIRTTLIRRFKHRFPDLDVVLFTGTTGAIPPLAPLTPADEATVLDSMFRKFEGISSTLLVSTRPFIRIPAPDRRRIDQPTEIEAQINSGAMTSWALLVSAKGTIVDGIVIDPFSEAQVAEMIDIVLKRDQ